MKSPALSSHDAPVEAGRDEHALASGRTLVIQTNVDGERIEIRSRTGDLEVQIALTENGPVLSLRGAELSIESLGKVAVNCREFEVNTSERVVIRAQAGVDVSSESEIRMKSAEQTFIDGDYVNLNCESRAGYHDDPARSNSSEASSD